MIIKFIHHNGKKRQVKVEKTPSFEELRKLAVKIWGKSVSTSLFGYIDCDEELITIVNQDDWEVCVEEMESMNADKKLTKLVVRILEGEDEVSLAESMVIKDTPKLETELSIAPTEQIEISRLEESEFNMMSSSQVDLEDDVPELVEVAKTEAKPETVPVPTELVREALNVVKDLTEVVNPENEPISSELQQALEASIVTSQLEEWKMVNQRSRSAESKEAKVEETPFDTNTDGDAQITEEKPEVVEEEETIFEDDSAPIKVVNTHPEDTLLEINVDGSDLEAVRQQVLNLAPLMGFEVERAEITTRETAEPTTEVEENKLNLSTCDTGRSSLTGDMRDEIQRMIQQRVAEELSRSGIQTERTSEPEDDCDTVHVGFSCDVCGVNPIKGVRFHSLIQRNYDLCSKCEKTNHQEHPMIRFRKNTHRGLAHGRGWTKINKIMSNSEIPHCRRFGRRGNPHVVTPGNVIDFFTNGVFGGARRGMQQAGKTIGEHVKEAAKKVGEEVSKVASTENKRGRGLCHVRTRPNPTPVPQVPTPAPVQRHPRFNEFSKVFTNACPEQLDAFLKKNDGEKDDNKLYNEAITLFLN